MTDQLYAVSPLDGRYTARTAQLSPYVSEAALMRSRIRIEVAYLFALADLDATPLTIEADERDRLRTLYEGFTEEDARRIKQLETEGYGEYEATNHDVKAIEYFLRLQTDESLHSWLHFGLTSEDVNNLAYRLLVRDALREVVAPQLRTVRNHLSDMAYANRDVPMLARTHGQPATPTTFGKEMAVYAARLGRTVAEVDAAIDALSGKLGGASGTYAAHVAAYPAVDWQAFAAEFVRDLGLNFTPLTTQVNPCDDLAALFDALGRSNTVLLDLDQDIWLYISQRYLGQEATGGETGSSTMPHKVNPIDFENSEGNLAKANADLAFLADSLATSRLQRDLSDSTVKRNIGVALSHCLIGYSKTIDGLSKITPNEEVMAQDLADHPEVIGEAVQTILRREGHGDAYERVKELTRGQSVTLDEFHELFDDLDLPAAVAQELKSLTPAEYTGIADKIVDDVE
jgi:adenylosuccinate lyase